MLFLRLPVWGEARRSLDEFPGEDSSPEQTATDCIIGASGGGGACQGLFLFPVSERKQLTFQAPKQVPQNLNTV